MTTTSASLLPSWTVGDTLPPMTGRLTYDNGTGPQPVDGTTATCEAHIRMGSAVIVRSVTVDSDGSWSMSWQPGDIVAAGPGSVEVQLTYPGGGVETFGPCTFRVRPQIA